MALGCFWVSLRGEWMLLSLGGTRSIRGGAEMENIGRRVAVMGGGGGSAGWPEEGKVFDIGFEQPSSRSKTQTRRGTGCQSPSQSEGASLFTMFSSAHQPGTSSRSRPQI